MSMKVKPKLTVGFCPEGSFGGRAYPFEDMFDKVVNVQKDGLENIDALILWGGSDIHPSLYKQHASSQSGAYSLPSNRDCFEWSCLKYCKIHDIPTIGICRGAQMQCAFAGGTLAQHVVGHNHGRHMVEMTDGQRFLVTSIHHQMMNPYTNKVPHTLLAWASPGLSATMYMGEDDRNISEMLLEREPEIVWFPEIRGLAIQGHPEYNMEGCDKFRDVCQQLVKEYILETEGVVS